MSSPRWVLGSAFALAISLGVGCGEPSGTSGSGGGGGGGTSCPNDLPASCPAEVPSYAMDVAPLLKARCSPCHFEGGTQAKERLGSYEEVFALRGPVLNQVYACAMPPEGGALLDAGERQTLFAWLVCGAPEN